LTLIISLIQKDSFQFNPAIIILTIFVIITEIKAISSSEHIYYFCFNAFCSYLAYQEIVLAVVLLFLVSYKSSFLNRH